MWHNKIFSYSIHKSNILIEFNCLRKIPVKHPYIKREDLSHRFRSQIIQMQIPFDRDTSVYIPTRAVQSNRIQQSCKTDLHDLDYKIRHHQRKKTKKKEKRLKRNNNKPQNMPLSKFQIIIYIFRGYDR